jgi:hypothetical protein
MERIVIKLLDNPDNPQLKMKYIGAIEYAVPKLGPDGKVRTGLDENSLDVLSLPTQKERETESKKIKKEREELERLLGQEFGPNSSFWDKFFVALTDEEIYLDPANPMDRLKERFLIANRYVAPSLEAISTDERYIDCIFYMFRDEEETSKKVVKQKKLDKAKAKLYILNEENPNKLKIVASYLFGYNAQVDLSAEKAYEKLSDYIDTKIEKQQVKNIEAFLEAVEKSPEEMKIKLYFDRAIRKRIITSKSNIYRRGDTVIGNSYEDALSNLGSIELNSELASIIKEVDKS